MDQENSPQLLKDFKVAYDSMNSENLANLFADSVHFKGTGDEGYKRVLRADIAEYFQKFVDVRVSQRVEFEGDSPEKDNGEISIDAVFHFVNKEQTEEIQKPISFEIKTQTIDGVEQIAEFGSFPREL